MTGQLELGEGAVLHVWYVPPCTDLATIVAAARQHHARSGEPQLVHPHPAGEPCDGLEHVRVPEPASP